MTARVHEIFVNGRTLSSVVWISKRIDGFSAIAWGHSRGTRIRKLRTGRFHGGREVRGPPLTREEIQRSEERPPSRFMARWIVQPQYLPEARVSASALSVQGDVRPMNQRVPPSHAMKQRALVLSDSSPPTTMLRSTSIGPDCRVSRICLAAAGLVSLRRLMREVPEWDSCQIALPIEVAEFHDPADFPAATRRPSGSPSGVKNPALIAASALRELPAWAASVKVVPGPSA